MQNKNTLLILLGLIFLFLIGYGVYTKTQKTPETNRDIMLVDDNDNDKDTEDTKTDSSMKGSMFDLLKSGDNLVCTFNSTSETGDVEGTTYISNNKMRGDFVIKDGISNMTSSMISDGEWLYSWSSAMPQGMKMKLDQFADQDSTNPDTPVSNENTDQTPLDDLKQDYDYDCDSWSVDASKFVIPTDVTFVDYSETLKQMQQQSGDMCQTCDSIPNEDAKAQCRSAYNCQ